jgi:nucleotide-binding universal stress UspA family protein
MIGRQRALEQVSDPTGGEGQQQVLGPSAAAAQRGKPGFGRQSPSLLTVTSAAAVRTSRAGKRTLRDTAALADEHGSRITVATIVGDEHHAYGCCTRSVQWNRILDEIALEEVALARSLIGDRDPPARFEIVPGHGKRAVAELVERLGCDLVLVPARRWVGGRRSLRRLRGALGVDVRAVRAA